MRISRVLAFLCLFAGLANAQSTTSITGTIKDNTGTLITSGQVAFTLQPGIDTVTSGIARFTPTEVDCLINASGLVKALDGVSVCTLVQNTSITNPANTSYKACIQPGFIQPGSCFVFYAIGSTLDITTVPATPSLTPAYNLVDTFSTQTISGNKTFSGTVTFGGPLNLGAISLGGALTATNGGTLGGTFTGNPTISGNPIFSGNPQFQNVLIPEGSAPTGSAGNDIIFGSSSLHRVEAINNAGSASVLAQFSDNLSVFATGGAISPLSVTTGQIIQPAATTATWKDSTGGIRASIPSNGTGQGTLNNWAIGGGSTYGGTTPSKQIFVASGTFTIPANVTAVKATVIGGGGAGGGSTASANGSGGGAAGFAQKWLSGLTPGNTIAVTVGAGGTGVSGAGGNAGGASSIASGTQTITTVTASGGGGGATTGTGIQAGGTGGSATNGDINAPGNGGGITFTAGVGGPGAAGVFGGSGAVADGAGTAPGAGGAGGNSGGTTTGGAGFVGMVIFEWVQ